MKGLVLMNIWVALGLSIAVGFTVSFLSGYGLIPFLHKLKFGQTILDIGPSWHKKKQGTPTMGGFLFILGFSLSLIAVLVTDKLMGGELLIAGREMQSDVVYTKIFAGLLFAAANGFIGFIDDYIKVVKKRNLGLTELQKTVMQLAVAVVYMFTLARFAGVNFMWIPYVGVVTNSVLFWFIGIIAIYCTVNAANFTDGVDGLCSSVTSVICVFFAAVAALRRFTGLSVVCCCLLGALLGFLMWNHNPAKVMMGDVGSLFLGAMVTSFAFTLDMPWIILLIAVVYVMEFGSDILQIAYVKTHNGKRLFKMAPIHHHYEMSGWSEKKICLVFSFIGIIGGAAALALVWFGRDM